MLQLQHAADAERRRVQSRRPHLEAFKTERGLATHAREVHELARARATADELRAALGRAEEKVAQPRRARLLP